MHLHSYNEPCAKSVRNEWAKLHSEIIDKIIFEPNLILNWVRLYTVARCILAAKPSSSKGQSHATKIKERIKRFKNNEEGTLWREAIKNHKKSFSKGRGQSKGKQVRKKSQEERNVERCSKLLEELELLKLFPCLKSTNLLMKHKLP